MGGQAVRGVRHDAVHFVFWLTHLRNLPAEVIKIDQSFVRDMLEDADDLAIVQGVIGLADAFHRAVIAEGVETSAHGKLLQELGCEVAQGYGIARPMPAADLPAWVRNWQENSVWLAQLIQLPQHFLKLARRWSLIRYASPDTVRIGSQLELIERHGVQNPFGQLSFCGRLVA